MTLLTTIIAAVTVTVIWYAKLHSNLQNTLRLGTLSLIYWGASLMWSVDAVSEYIKCGAEYFKPSAAQMLNDTYLGLTATALGLVIWLVILLTNDPDGVIKSAIMHNNKKNQSESIKNKSSKSIG